MKVALCFNLNRGRYDYEAEFDRPITIQVLQNALARNYDVYPLECTRDVSDFVRHLQKLAPSTIFNIAEGFVGPAREAFYPALFDQLGLRYAGPDVTNLLMCQNKYLTNRILSARGLPVPRGWLVRDKESLSLALQKVRYPVLLKPNAEGSGLGLSAQELIHDAASLVAKLKKTSARFGSNVLLEEYLTGRDVSAAFLEGHGILGFCQVVCQDGSPMYDYAHKTSKDAAVTIEPVRDLGSLAMRQLKKMSLAAVQALDLRGYAKIDFRVGEDGGLHILEVNGQVSFHPKGEFMVCAESAGWDMTRLTRYIVEHSVSKSCQEYSVGVGINYD